MSSSSLDAKTNQSLARMNHLALDSRDKLMQIGDMVKIDKGNIIWEIREIDHQNNTVRLRQCSQNKFPSSQLLNGETVQPVVFRSVSGYRTDLQEKL